MVPGPPDDPVTATAEDKGQRSLFKWETMRLVRAHALPYKGSPVIQGKILEVELTSGPAVRVWRSEDGTPYFCHGLTLGGKAAPEGIVSPLEDDAGLTHTFRIGG